MIRILHVSDTHFGTEVSEVTCAFWRTMPSIMPGLVICSGDVTQRAHRRQFETAAQFFRGFGDIPRVVVPGNHDIPLWNLVARFLRPYAGFEASLGSPEGVLDLALVKVVAVDSTRRHRHKDGAISELQMRASCSALAAASERQLRIVVAHHPMYIPSAADRKNQLSEGVAHARRWAEAGADLVLGGHIHLPYCIPLAAIAPTGQRSLWIVQAGTALSRRVRPNVPNSFNVLEWDGAACEVERWDFDATGKRFAPVLRTRIRVSRYSSSSMNTSAGTE